MRREIRAGTHLRATRDRAREVLLDDPGRILVEHTSPVERAERQYRTSLGAATDSGAAIEQEVLVELGHARTEDAATVLPVHWSATAHEELFPAFDGELRVEAAGSGSRLVLSGTYRVPLGVVGGFGDTVVGRRVARRSLESLLERMAERLDIEVGRRDEESPVRPAPYPVDLREYTRSEDDPG